MKTTLMAIMLSITMLATTPVFPVNGKVPKYVDRLGFVYYSVYNPKQVVAYVKVGINEFYLYKLPKNSKIKPNTYVKVHMNPKKTTKYSDDKIISAKKSRGAKDNIMLHYFSDNIKSSYKKNKFKDFKKGGK